MDYIKIFTSFLSNYIKMEEGEIEVLKKITSVKSFKKKEIIHQQGQVQKHLAFLVKGAIRFYYVDNEGSQHTFEFALENVLIGNYKGVIDRDEAPAFAETTEDTVLVAIYRDHFLAFLEQFPRYYSVVTTIMGSALVDMDLRDKLLRIPSSRERYQEFCELRPELITRIPLTHIASYLNMALGTLSKVRAGKL